MNKRRAVDPRTHKIFTTGQAAELLGVSSNTVKRWCDANQIQSYTVPHGEDRRIRREALIAFMLVHRIPATDMGEDATLYTQQAERAAKLEDVAGRLLSVVAFAISKGMPITQEIADARNDACALLPKTLTTFSYTTSPETAPT